MPQCVEANRYRPSREPAHHHCFVGACRQAHDAMDATLTPGASRQWTADGAPAVSMKRFSGSSQRTARLRALILASA